MYNFNFFADDGQLYIIFDPVGPNRVKLTQDKIEELIADVSQWLLTYMLMFNGGKTDVLLMHYKYMHLEPFPPLNICNDLVHTSLSACNLGILFMNVLQWTNKYLLFPSVISVISEI